MSHLGYWGERVGYWGVGRGAGGWGRRGYPYGDYHRKRWRTLRGLPTVFVVSAPYGGCSRCRAAPPPEPRERRRSLRTPKTQNRESTKILGSQWSSASWAYLLSAPFLISTCSIFSI